MGDHEYAVGEMVLIKAVVDQVLITPNGTSYFVRTSKNTLKVQEDELSPDNGADDHDRER
jgi:hypothetical protein